MDQQIRLEDAVDSIPPFFMADARINCQWEQKGSVMRQLGEYFSERRQHTSDGIRIDVDDGWVLLTPDSDGPYIVITAEGASAAHAAELIANYSEVVRRCQYHTGAD